MRLAIALIAALALAIAGCGETSDGEPGAPPGDTGTGADERPDRPEDGALFVDQRSDRTGGQYIEGAVPYVKVVASDGEAVLKQSFPRAPADGSLVRTTLRPGSYRITSWVRPGSGAGRPLDPATDRCSAALEVPPSGAVTATVARSPGRECRIDLDQMSFSDIVAEDVEEARAAVERRGFQMRVVERDGESLPVTLDLRFDRLNVAVEDGRVSGLRGIG